MWASICSGSNTQWCAPAGLATYLWSTGATTQCIVVNFANTFTVTVSDANAVLGDLLLSGYFLNDCNLSGIVTAADVNIVFDNLNVASQVP